MEVITVVIPMKTVGSASGSYVVAHPKNLKIQTTGAEGETLFNSGPPNGKQWTVDIQLSIVETDLP